MSIVSWNERSKSGFRIFPTFEAIFILKLPPFRMKLIRVFARKLLTRSILACFLRSPRVIRELFLKVTHTRPDTSLSWKRVALLTDLTGYFPLKTRVDRVSLILSIMMLPRSVGRMSKRVAVVTKVVQFRINSIEQLVPRSVLFEINVTGQA